MNGKFAYKLETPVGEDRDQPSSGRGTSTHGDVTKNWLF